MQYLLYLLKHVPLSHLKKPNIHIHQQTILTVVFLQHQQVPGVLTKAHLAYAFSLLHRCFPLHHVFFAHPCFCHPSLSFDLVL